MTSPIHDACIWLGSIADGCKMHDGSTAAETYHRFEPDDVKRLERVIGWLTEFESIRVDRKNRAASPNKWGNRK